MDFHVFLQLALFLGLVILSALALRQFYPWIRPFFPSAEKRLPVLMYHKISADSKDALTVLSSDFAAQLDWLKINGFETISCKELHEFLLQQRPLPAKPVMLTFDDGYVNNIEIALPLLQSRGMKATIFLPVKFIGGVNEWDDGKAPLVTEEMIKAVHGKTFEFALHSYGHINYRHCSCEMIEDDLKAMTSKLSELSIPYFPAFAYPYGGVPKDSVKKASIKNLLSRYGICLAFRIKDRHNPIPPRDALELFRIGISGADNLNDFSFRVLFGKKNLF